MTNSTSTPDSDSGLPPIREDDAFIGWTVQGPKHPFWEAKGPVEVRLFDGSREVWREPRTKWARDQADNVDRWRRVPAGLWIDR